MADIKTLNAGAKDLGDGASYTPSGVPVTGDSLLIIDGDQQIDTNLDALAGVTLASFRRSQTFRGSIGDAGESMQIGGVTGTALIEGGGGDDFINPGACTLLVVRDMLGALLAVTGGSIDKAVAYAGRIQFGTSCGLGSLYNLGAALTVKAAGTSITDAYNRYGTMDLFRSVDIFRLWSGVVFARDAAAVSDLLEINGGSWFHRSEGDIEELFGAAGEFRTKGARKDFAISTKLTRFKGFNFAHKEGGVKVTLPPTIDDFGYEGDDSGSGVKS